MQVKFYNINKIDNTLACEASIKGSGVLYFLFIIFLTCLLIHRHGILNQKEELKSTIYDDTDYAGIECAYSFEMLKNIKVWERAKIYIKYNPVNNCSKHNLSKLKDIGGSTFRVQAYSIYEMVTSSSEYIGNHTYIVEFLVSFPTKYKVIVLMTYVNGEAMASYKHTNPILRQLHNSPLEVNVKRAPIPKTVGRYCTNQESGIITGRWIKCGWAIGGLERCGAWQSPDFDFDHIHGFRWVPFVCQYHQYTNDEMKRCFAQNEWDSIVFAGDSHMRYRAYHWATRLYGSCHSCAKTHIKMLFDKVPRIEWVFDARGTRLPLSFSNISLPFEKYIHPKVRRSKFSTLFPEDAIKSKLFLLNFGHWVLREINEQQFIISKLHAYGKAARILKDRGCAVIWVNTVSLPWRTDQAVIEWRENTSPFRVREFNKIADSVMGHYGIPVVDAYQISDGRIGATHDQTHYTKKLVGNDFGGVVENAITNSIINLLCNK